MTAAAFISLLVTAVKAFAVVVSALMPLTVVVSAFMVFSMVMPALVAFPVMMVVVVAPGVGIIREPAFGQRLDRRVRGAVHAAVELDPRLSQRILCPHADAAADQCIRMRCFQEAGQCAVPAAVGWYDLLRDNYTVLHIVELELLRVAKVLEDLSVFVSYCNSHIACSFLNDILCSLIVEPIVSAPDQELFSVYQCVSDFPPCALVNGC